MTYPAPVERRLGEIRKSSAHKVYIRLLKGRYYVYEVASVLDAATNQKKRLAYYLGKISDDGKFSAARSRKRPETRMGSADEWLKAKESGTGPSPMESLMHPDPVDLKILTAISTDGRATISEIAKEVGISRASASSRLNRLANTYGIKYTLEFGYSFFGFSRYAAFVKFTDNNKPDLDKLISLLENEPTIQYAALLKGNYDLFMYIFAEDTTALEHKIYELRSNSALASYKTAWNVSYIIDSYGYVPVRPKFFERLEAQVWHKSKEFPRKSQDQLLLREYVVLKELNDNGNMAFSDIDEKYDFSPGAAYYTYQKLFDRHIIYRITITMKRLPFMYLAVSQCKQLDMEKFNSKRDAYLLDVIMDNSTPVNKYVLIGDTGSPYGLLYITPVSGSSGLRDIEDNFRKVVDGSEVESHIIIKTLVGTPGFRKFDNTKSPQYKVLQMYQKGQMLAHVPNPIL